QQYGQVAPLRTTLWTGFNLVPCAILALLLPLLFARLRPRDIRDAPPQALDDAEVNEPTAKAAEAAITSAKTPAGLLQRSPALTILLTAGALAYVVYRGRTGSLTPDVNFVIFLFTMTGLALHGRPIRYVRAWNQAARSSGPLLLQYPLYGGILGLLTDSSLAER